MPTRKTSVADVSSLSRLESISPEFKNSIFCFGGYGGETECLAYVTTTDKWIKLCDLPTPRVMATACPAGLLERDRSLIIAGGRDANGRPSRSAYRFDCNYLVWKPISSLLVKREGCGSAFSSGHAFVVGGRTPQEWTNRVEYYNPIANKWSEICPMKHSREGCGVASLNDKLYVAGGNQYGNSDLDIVEWFDMKRDQWCEGKSMLEARWGCGLTSVGGSLYAIGGYRKDTVERYDPREGSWHYCKSMLVRRRRVSVALFDNQIYTFGGWIDDSRMTAVECYDVRANSWTFTTPLPSSKSSVAMTTLFGLYK